jgi:hypothetical protein
VESAGGRGIFFDATSGGINGSVINSVVAGSGNTGISAVGTGGSPINIMIDRSALVNNVNFGIVSNGAQIRIGNSTVSGNRSGLATANGGTILSFVTNKINDNLPRACLQLSRMIAQAS